MVNIDDRIRLWRNTIQLFHRYRRSNFTGPLYASGFNDYRVEHKLLERSSGKESQPDIIACSPRGWLIIELTGSDNSKGPKLDSYKKSDPRCLGNFGWRADYPSPDVIISRLSAIDDGDHCQILVDSKLQVSKDHFLTDQSLRNALVSTQGKNLSRLPEIPVTLLPEMKQGLEIRRGLIDIVLQLFSPGNKDGMSDYEMCMAGLERLSDKVPSGEIHSLQGKVKAEMDGLAKSDLVGYVEYKDGKYRATDKYKEHPRARETIAKKLRDWAYPPNRTLADFS